METASTTTTSDRNVLFLSIKPCCVNISQLAIRESTSPKAARELVQLTHQLLEILDTQIARNPTALDDKLAEYVFFPLYYIFRQVDQYPAPLVENCVKCLAILVGFGWKSKLSSKLFHQILNLLLYILDGVPGSNKKQSLAEETELETLRALKVLFTTAGSSPNAISGLADPETVPELGHGITVTLEAVLNGATPDIQMTSLGCISELYAVLKDQDVLASFLPGVISSITKALSASARYKKAVLAECLKTTRLVLVRVLSDLRTRSILASKNEETETEDKGRILSPAWLKATVAQVKVALSTMMKLRTSDEPEVREALERLCITLLDECHTTLSDSSTFLVETAVVLDSRVSRISTAQTSLAELVSIYPESGETVKTVLYNWLSKLPHIMRANDEAVKQHAIRNLSKGMDLLKDLGIESPTLEDLLYASLRDSVVALILASKSSHEMNVPQLQILGEEGPELPSLQASHYHPVILSQESQRRVRSDMMALIQTVSSSQQSNVANVMLEYTRGTTSDSRVAAFWLCFELVKSAFASEAEEDSLLDLSAFSGSNEAHDAVFRDLYAFSVELLDSHTDLTPVDWRLEAIALEVTAYAAQRSGMAFRPELIDVLFPITSFLGSDNLHLQSHAIVTLNSLSTSCQYQNVSELLIDNVDYMVNSVSLRLNSLDISPASTKVLKMMIRLAGPQLIPFLDDVVESIFAALENYHGYPAFVESLFSVLKETVDQGVKSDQLLLKTQKQSNVDHKKKRPQHKAFQSLMDFLDKQDKQKERDEAEDRESEAARGHPERPWKDSSKAAEEEAEEVEGTPAKAEEPKPPNTPTYQLLERISSLSQHYLTSPIPELRRTLLELVSKASTALAADEDAFLPLVNAIWPVVIDRLRDPETFVTIAACDTLSQLCAAAGDFLSSRFQTEWGDGLRDWCQKVKRQAAGKPTNTVSRGTRANPTDETSDILIPSRAGDGLALSAPSKVQPTVSGALGQYASTHKIWEACVKLLTSIVSHVRVDEEMFDDILEILAEEMEKDQAVKDALETINADAVWLVRYDRGLVEKIATPEVDGLYFVPM